MTGPLASCAHPTRIPRGIAEGSVICAVASTGVVALTAAAVLVAGFASDARGVLGFGFEGVTPSCRGAADIAIDNARLAGATLLCATVAPRLGPLVRTVVEVSLATLLALNAGLVGLALGAYGGRLVVATALHLPIEFGALSLAGGAYIHATGGELRHRELAVTTGACVLMLSAAAVIETYVSIGGLR